MNKVKVGIVGSRSFSDYQLLEKTIYNKFNLEEIIIISGGAKGADSLAEKFASLNNVETKIYLPEWDKYKKSAGFIRNQQIVDDSDIIIAFWDGTSKGTQHSINLAKKKDIEVVVIKY